MKAWIAAMVVFSLIASCATTSNTPEVKQPPKITQDTSLEDALQASIDFGGDTGKSVRKLLVKRKEWPAAEKILAQAIQDGVIKYDNHQLLNAVMLYVSGPVTPSETLFQKMVSSGRPFARQLGWQMAAALPSKTMRIAIERELNRALMEGEEVEMMVPQMAMAVQANRMTSAYTLVRQGLMTTNHEDFASAMVTLNPEKATEDFVDYLATCPPEELRQMTVKSINVYAATIALTHLTKNLPDVNHPRLDAMFYYSISRNPALNDLGSALIDQLALRNNQQLAIILARLPAWSQVAFIENSRRNMSAGRRVFLGELKRVTAQNEVIEELGEIKL